MKKTATCRDLGTAFMQRRSGRAESVTVLRILQDRIIFPLLGFGLAVLALPAQAEACTVCVVALADKWLPPIIWWMLATAVFLLAFSLAFHSQRKALGLPKLGTVVLLVVLALLGMGFIGPVAFAPLVLILIRSVFRVIRKKPAPFTMAQRGVLLLSGLVVLVLAGMSVSIQLHRAEVGPAAFILEYPNTGPAMTELKSLSQQGDYGFDQIRLVLEKGDHSALLGQAARLLAEHGAASEDVVPLLLSALERIQAMRDDRYGGDTQIHLALVEITGLDLPHPANAAEWRQALAARGEQKDQPPSDPSPTPDSRNQQPHSSSKSPILWIPKP